MNDFSHKIDLEIAAMENIKRFRCPNHIRETFQLHEGSNRWKFEIKSGRATLMCMGNFCFGDFTAEWIECCILELHSKYAL